MNPSTPTPPEFTTETRISEKFNFKDYDVSFQSKDSVLYLVHRKNLDSCSKGFPPPEFKSSKVDVVLIPESSRVLDLLFMFVYPDPLPDVKKLPFDLLADLAEAAEKYQVTSARLICNLCMSAVVNDHPVELLQYAARHHYEDLLDSAAPLAIGKPLAEVIRQLPSHAIIAWSQYYQLWHHALADIYATYRPKCPKKCDYWKTNCVYIMEKLNGKPELLRNVGSDCSFSGEWKYCCGPQMDEWREKVVTIASSLPKLSTF